MLLSIAFLVMVGFVLPALSWSSHRSMGSPDTMKPALLSTRAIACQIVLVQAIVAGFASLAVWAAGLTVAWASRLTVAGVLTAIGIVGAASVVALVEGRRPLGRGTELRRLLRSVSPGDPVWLVATAVAAVCEEFAYRGVLVEILSRPLGPAGAAVASAVVFALGHLAQGWRGAAFSLVFGLGMQTLVALSGGLTLAIVAHLTYDLVAAALGRRLAVRECHESAA